MKDVLPNIIMEAFFHIYIVYVKLTKYYMSNTFQLRQEMKFDNLAPGLISTPQAHIIPHAFYPNIPFGCVPKYTHEYDKKLILENTALLT